jgi:catechol 2,3-dioxygenase-like lactoylglutathione lyase family enzyme
MFDHVTIRVADRLASERFYDLVLRTIGVERSSAPHEYTEWGDFSLAPAGEGDPPTRNLHVGFAAPDRDAVRAFWQAGVDAGFTSDGEPGPRPEYGGSYFGAFLLDPDGNSAEAVVHDTLRSGGAVDHLWIRVRDVDASQRFYEAVAPHGGFRLKEREERLARFTSGNGSFSVLEDDRPVTEHLHLAFGAADTGPVDAFHAALTAAGHGDHGAPGERPEYHPGYYGAFVLDPDGNNVEVVHHDRPGSSA